MKLDTKISAALFAFTTGTILFVAIVATGAMAWGAPPALRLPFRLLCHGIESRCLELFGGVMPICARCSGIYAGALAGIAGFIATRRLRLPPMPWLLLLLLVLPLAVDGVTQAIGLRGSGNALRLATGVLAGGAFFFWALDRIETSSARRESSKALQRVVN
ncbi:MAG TPA: DUF2085 domain-containing protein [Thermoanaerobaculia bacterium]|nr:DUF2085 domain-containing protein [Thermoanaerobaculia bacterium]